MAQYVFEGSLGCIIVFDKNDNDYERNIVFWLNTFQKTMRYSSIPIFVVGIKSETKENIDLEAKQLTEGLNALYFETTINDKESVNQIFSEMAMIIDRFCS